MQRDKRDDLKAMERLRQNKWRFIILTCKLDWGVTTGVITYLLKLLAQDKREIDFFYLTIHLVVFLAVGTIGGYIAYRLINRRYQRIT